MSLWFLNGGMLLLVKKLQFVEENWNEGVLFYLWEWSIGLKYVLSAAFKLLIGKLYLKFC